MHCQLIISHIYIYIYIVCVCVCMFMCVHLICSSLYSLTLHLNHMPLFVSTMTTITNKWHWDSHHNTCITKFSPCISNGTPCIVYHHMSLHLISSTRCAIIYLLHFFGLFVIMLIVIKAHINVINTLNYFLRN